MSRILSGRHLELWRKQLLLHYIILQPGVAFVKQQRVVVGLRPKIFYDPYLVSEERRSFPPGTVEILACVGAKVG